MKEQDNPTAYQACSQPRPRAEVEQSLTEFWQELRALRLKHKLAQVVCVVEANVTDEQGLGVVYHLGDQRLHSHLIGQAYLSMTEKKP